MCKCATARINYRATYSPDKTTAVIDTTVKSGSGLGAIFAPTWRMVMDVKAGRITWQQYTAQYYALIRTRYTSNKHAFIDALLHDELVLTCYCRDTSTTTRHCHRYLLVDILEKVAARHDLPFEYIGEVK